MIGVEIEGGTHISVHTQRMLKMRAEELIQRVVRRQAALRRDDVRLGAGVRAQVVRHQLVHRAVQAAEGRLHHLPHLRSTWSWVTQYTAAPAGGAVTGYSSGS